MILKQRIVSKQIIALAIALFLGIKEIGSAKASIISTVDPVVTIMFGMLLLGEVLSSLQLSGVVLVIASIILVNRIKESDSEPKFEKIRTTDLS